MSSINHEELKKQLASGEELTSHLGYDKHKKSHSSNSRNGYNEKTIKSKYDYFEGLVFQDSLTK